MSQDQFRQVNNRFYQDEAAKIYAADVLNPFTAQKFTIDLSTARSAVPYVINFPFSSIAFKNATGGAGQVLVTFNKDDSGISAIPFDNNDALYTSRKFDGCFIRNIAQAGKKIDIIVYTNAEFRSGSLINSGTISIAGGSSVTGPTRIVVPATTATIIIPANPSNKTTTLQNKTGASLYIGGSTIGAVGGVNEGIEIPAKGIIYHTNTAALYGWSVAGGNVSYVVEN